MSALTQYRVAVNPENYQPLGVAQLPALPNEQALLVPDGAQFVLIQAMGNNVTWRDDGVPMASAGDGMVIIENDTIQYQGDLSAVRVLNVAGQVNLAFYRWPQ